MDATNVLQEDSMTLKATAYLAVFLKSRTASRLLLFQTLIYFTSSGLCRCLKAYKLISGWNRWQLKMFLTRDDKSRLCGAGLLLVKHAENRENDIREGNSTN